MFFTPKQDVARGAKFLDKKIPGWDERINLDTLDVGDERVCALAQASGQHFARAYIDHRLSEFQLMRLGFCSSKAERYPALTDAWKALILARRTAAAA